MGKEIIVSSLEEMCDLMCDNYIPKENYNEDRNRDSMYGIDKDGNSRKSDITLHEL